MQIASNTTRACAIVIDGSGKRFALLVEFWVLVREGSFAGVVQYNGQLRTADKIAGFERYGRYKQKGQ